MLDLLRNARPDVLYPKVEDILKETAEEEIVHVPGFTVSLATAISMGPCAVVQGSVELVTNGEAGLVQVVHWDQLLHRLASLGAKGIGCDSLPANGRVLVPNVKQQVI